MTIKQESGRQRQAESEAVENLLSGIAGSRSKTGLYSVDAQNRHCSKFYQLSSGWGGIRTPVTVSRKAVFKTAAFDHSATHPVARANLSRVAKNETGNQRGTPAQTGFREVFLTSRNKCTPRPAILKVEDFVPLLFGGNADAVESEEEIPIGIGFAI